MLDRALSLFRKFKIDYGEFREERDFSTSISLRDRETSVSSGESRGISVRMLLLGSWGFASTDDLSKVEEIFKKAYGLAKISKGKSRVEIDPSLSGKHKTKTKIPLEDIGVEDKMKDARELQKLLEGKSISSTSVRYSDSTSTEGFVNTSGSECEQASMRVYAAFTSVAKNNGLMQRASERMGVSAGYEAVEQCFSLAQDCPKRAFALLSASLAPAGKHLVIIDGRMTGLLCHEALGHACEADSILAGSSILKGKIGAGIGSPLVTIRDDPSIPGAFGSFAFDDEGVKSRGTILVEKGRLKNYLQSRETAAKLSSKPTGNARAQAYAFTPIVRMSNTVMARGESQVEELFEGLKHGVYARGMSGGCVDTTTGYFVFAAEDGYLIENGRKTKLLRDVLLSGNVVETLMNVDMVANDFLGSPGFCGKAGQSVPVSDGGPHVRVREVVVGGKAP